MDESTFVLMLSDTHCGHRNGLMNPNTVLEAKDQNGDAYEYTPPLNKIQSYLWDTLLSGLEEVERIADGRDICVLANGDLTTGDKHADELVSGRMADQIIIAKQAFGVFMGLRGMKKMFIAKGTGAHNYGFGSSEILIANYLDEGYDHVETRISVHYLIDWHGLTMDVAHHGPTPGSRNWLKGNEARYYIRSIMMDEFMSGKIPPRIIYRGHYHDYIREDLTIKYEGKWYTSTFVLTPSLTWINYHGMQSVKSPSRITHGMVLCEICGGELLKVHPLTKTIDMRTKEIF